jgi:hypothetical protein
MTSDVVLRIDATEDPAETAVEKRLVVEKFLHDGRTLVEPVCCRDQRADFGAELGGSDAADLESIFKAAVEADVVGLAELSLPGKQQIDVACGGGAIARPAACLLEEHRVGAPEREAGVFLETTEKAHPW